MWFHRFTKIFRWPLSSWDLQARGLVERLASVYLWPVAEDGYRRAAYPTQLPSDCCTHSQFIYAACAALHDDFRSYFGLLTGRRSSIGRSRVSVNNTLAFVKTANTTSAHVEVHLASGMSGYMKRIFETACTFAEEADGVWQFLPNQDLVFTKTRNTLNGPVEVHIASRAVETPTTFESESESTWQLLPNRDLLFIKTSITPSGYVEVHIPHAP